VSYRITREIRPDGDAIIFEWQDRQSEQELLRDFSQLQRLHKYAWRNRRGVAWYRRLQRVISATIRLDGR
jgi:hypothetical protein